MSLTSFLLIAVLAQTAPPAAETAGKAKAQRLLSEGATLYAQGEMAPALEKFEQAYAEYPSPKLLFNIGQASRDLGRLAEAMDAFERFLAELSDDFGDMTAEAKQSVAVLRGKLGRLRISCDGANVEIRVDGKKIKFSPPSRVLWVMPGNHEVTARYPDFAPLVGDIDVAADELRDFVVRLKLRSPDVTSGVANANPAGTIPAAAAGLVPAVAPAASGWWLGRKWTWLVAGGAAVFAAGGAGFGLAAQAKFDALNRSCGNASVEHLGCAPGDIDRVTALKNTANVFWALAGVAAGTAGVLFYFEGRAVAVTPSLGATGLVAVTEF